jgi:hypothetical protein
MRFHGAVAYVLALSCSESLIAAQLPSGGSVPVTRVIDVGEQVSGELHPNTFTPTGFIPAVDEIVYVLTAPSDGTLIVTLNWEFGSLGLSDELGELSFFPNWWPPTVAILPVVAGRTYRLTVSTSPWDNFGALFVLSTSIEPGPVVIPPGCETIPPGRDWICVNGGWVDANHPLAKVGQPSAPVPSPEPAAPPGVQPCPTVQPGPTWKCVSGGWLPADHPDALTVAPTPVVPSLPPLTPLPSPNACVGPDPFAGIPGMVGVCVNGNWVPLGHPLAGSGG